MAEFERFVIIDKDLQPRLMVGTNNIEDVWFNCGEGESVVCAVTDTELATWKDCNRVIAHGTASSIHVKSANIEVEGNTIFAGRKFTVSEEKSAKRIELNEDPDVMIESVIEAMNTQVPWIKAEVKDGEITVSAKVLGSITNRIPFFDTCLSGGEDPIVEEIPEAERESYKLQEARKAARTQLADKIDKLSSLSEIKEFLKERLL